MTATTESAKKAWITRKKKYGTTGVKDPTSCNKNPSVEHKHNISNSLVGRKLSDEHRKNIGTGHTGKTCSEGTKINLREARSRRKKTLGYINSPETRKKMSVSQKERFRNHPITEETRAKMSVSLLGIPKQPRTEEHRKNLSKAIKEKIVDGEFVPWNKDLTKETDERVRRNGQSISDSYNILTEIEKQERLQNSMFKASQAPNISEQILTSYLKPLGFTYTGGDNKKKIAGHRPDFSHIECPLLIEHDGPGGHDPNVPWVPENKAELDDQRDEDYRRDGKEVLRLLPEDLVKGREFVQQKVRDCMTQLGYPPDWIPFNAGEWFK